MFQQLLNWRTGLAAIAILIVTGTVFYSGYVSRKIAKEERARVNAFAEALKLKGLSLDPNVILFTSQLTQNNDDIPIIETDEKGNPSGIYINLDSTRVANDSNYLRRKVKQFGNINPPVRVEILSNPVMYNNYYYGGSALQDEVRYYPLVQLFIVSLFIIITLTALRSSYRSTQNQVWAGMAKETAHQLGTPVSSLEGWVEMMKDKPENQAIVTELEKDVNRLRLVSDRFGKIGSTPQLEELDLLKQVNSMVDYIRKRAPGKVIFSVDPHGKDVVPVKISGPLFDWVIENLLKNALDSMEGKGSITVDIFDNTDNVTVDVTDTGKGISNKNQGKVFKPGFTTKKRGWGLGLSLCKRIIVQYHKGELFIKQSEPGKGTTFRIILRKKPEVSA